MKTRRLISILIALALFLSGCSSAKTYKLTDNAKTILNDSVLEAYIEEYFNAYLTYYNIGKKSGFRKTEESLENLSLDDYLKNEKIYDLTDDKYNIVMDFLYLSYLRAGFHLNRVSTITIPLDGSEGNQTETEENKEVNKKLEEEYFADMGKRIETLISSYME